MPNLLAQDLIVFRVPCVKNTHGIRTRPDLGRRALLRVAVIGSEIGAPENAPIGAAEARPGRIRFPGLNKISTGARALDARSPRGEHR
jgi:hypothetical protein